MLFTNIRPIAFAIALALPIAAHAEPNWGGGKESLAAYGAAVLARIGR